MTESEKLYETVIKNNYCIGCGVCATVEDSPFKMIYNEFGNVVAQPINANILNSNNAKVLHICPFSSETKSEDQLANIYLKNLNKTDKHLGHYNTCFAGYVQEGEYREKGSSGGILKWFATELLNQNYIDYFIQLSSNNSNDTTQPLFSYQIFDKTDDIINGSKSSYYPVSLDNVINVIKKKEGRYAITGIPCFIKAIRLLSENNPIIKDRVKYLLGIICGGMKSANHSKMVGWQLGIHPNHLIGIDFRRKYKNRPADQKIYQVWSNSDAKERYKDVTKLYGTDYGAGFFMPKACNYCDDVVSELADISVGDAWLNKFTYDPKGTSLIIVRNQTVGKILAKAKHNNKLLLSNLSKEEVIQAQAGGFRHRREGLSFRLQKRKHNKEWAPKKRIIPDQYQINEKREQVYTLRELISERSHLAFKKALDKNDLNTFYIEMHDIFKKYKNLNRESKLRLLLRKLKRIVYYDILRKC